MRYTELIELFGASQYLQHQFEESPFVQQSMVVISVDTSSTPFANLEFRFEAIKVSKHIGVIATSVEVIVGLISFTNTFKVFVNTTIDRILDCYSTHMFCFDFVIDSSIESAIIDFGRLVAAVTNSSLKAPLCALTMPLILQFPLLLSLGIEKQVQYSF